VAPELVAEVTAQRRAMLDLDDWDERVRWRHRRLPELATVLEEGSTAGVV
jgi:hypothetical protein